MQDNNFASHTLFGGHMDANIYDNCNVLYDLK